MALGSIRNELLLLPILLVVVSHALTISSHLNQEDKVRLKGVFDNAAPHQDLATTHYAVLGYKLLAEVVPNPKDVCKYAQSQVDGKNVESIYYASGISVALGNCPVTSSEFQETLNAAVIEGVSSQNLFFAVAAMKNLGLKYDSAKISKILTAARKKDDGALSLGYALHVASMLMTDVSSFVDWVEDTVVQADEVDGRMLQFEGGLSVSAIVVGGIYRLGEVSKKPLPAIDGEKCIKFANYFLSRKQVQVVRPAYHLLDVLQLLVSNKLHVPVSVGLTSPPAVHLTKPAITVRVSNIMGGSLGPMTVTLNTVTKLNDKTELTVNKPLSPVKDDKQLYESNLLPLKLKRGLYQLSIGVKPGSSDPRLIGIDGAQVQARLVTDADIENVELGVGDVDQSTSVRLTPVQHPNKLPTVLEADYHQKIQMKFSLNDKIAKEVMTVHQSFVMLIHKKTSQEIVFVAEADSSNVYKFDLDVQAKAKDFGSLSGVYDLSLIVGDSLVSNPILWHVADVEITFQETSVPRHKESLTYEPKSEIRHVFREPEKRPVPIVSNAFTVLVALPLVLLFVLWKKIGVNVSNFSLSLGTIGFYSGLAGIFGLFFVFWLHLSMFETLKYLMLLGIVTFLCGNRMLRKIAATRG